MTQTAVEDELVEESGPILIGQLEVRLAHFSRLLHPLWERHLQDRRTNA
jgi:hypothetical protein